MSTSTIDPVSSSWIRRPIDRREDRLPRFAVGSNTTTSATIDVPDWHREAIAERLRDLDLDPNSVTNGMPFRSAFANYLGRSVSPIKYVARGHRRGPLTAFKFRVISLACDEPESRKRRENGGTRLREHRSPHLDAIRTFDTLTIALAKRLAVRSRSHSLHCTSSGCQRAALCAARVSVRETVGVTVGCKWGVSDPLCHPPVEVLRVKRGGAHAPDACHRRPAEPRFVDDNAECAADIVGLACIDFVARTRLSGLRRKPRSYW
jgi:hypothetical protein